MQLIHKEIHFSFAKRIVIHLLQEAYIFNEIFITTFSLNFYQYYYHHSVLIQCTVND